MNILLVDDDSDGRAYVGEFLRKLGHHVVECRDGQDGLEAFGTGDYHMVLSDLKMPRLSGIELLHALSSFAGGRDFDVVLLTGHGGMDSAIEALRAGAYDYLLKPVNVEELAAVTERVAERQALRRENKILTEKFEDEVKAATEETRHELARLRKAYCESMGVSNLVVFSEAMKTVLKQARRLHADRSVPVFIEGETGTGKEVIARYVHYGRGDVSAPFVDLNCAAIAPSIFESELFGYEAGAFTGGLPKGRKGKLDMAAGGTLFLDEIAEIPVELQAKLLRVIQEKEFYRVGGLKKIKTDVRVICATNVDIEKKIKQKAFRQDLFYRLSVGRITLLPLRQRKEDILPLAGMFLANFAREKGKRFRTISGGAADMLLSYEWPGNVRELKNAVEWAVLMWDDSKLKPVHLGILKDRKKGAPVETASAGIIDCNSFTLPSGSLPIEEYFDNIIIEALKLNKGNKTQTAKYLGISRRSLYSRLKRLTPGS